MGECCAYLHYITYIRNTYIYECSFSNVHKCPSPMYALCFSLHCVKRRGTTVDQTGVSETVVFLTDFSPLRVRCGSCYRVLLFLGCLLPQCVVRRVWSWTSSDLQRALLPRLSIQTAIRGEYTNIYQQP